MRGDRILDSGLLSSSATGIRQTPLRPGARAPEMLNLYGSDSAPTCLPWQCGRTIASQRLGPVRAVPAGSPVLSHLHAPLRPCFPNILRSGAVAPLSLGRANLGRVVHGTCVLFGSVGTGGWRPGYGRRNGSPRQRHLIITGSNWPPGRRRKIRPARFALAEDLRRWALQTPKRM